jgi:hypothetical protein
MCPLNGLFPSGSHIKLFVFLMQQQGEVKQWLAKQYSGSVEKLIKKETGKRIRRKKMRKLQI